jgi:NADH:ubiquinone oxidoreductase subunit H
LMALEWKIVFPISMANVLVTAIVLVLVGGK